MPTVRFSKKSRSSNKKKLFTGNKRRRDTAQSKAIVSLQKNMKKILRSDPIYVQSSVGAITSLVNSTPKSELLNGIVQGDTNITRDGAKVRWKYLHVDYILKGQTSHVNTSYVQLMLVQRKDPAGASFSFSEFLTDSTPAYITQFNYLTADWKNHFNILWTKSFVIGPRIIDYTSATGHSTAHPYEYVGEFSKRFDITTAYNLGNAGTVADIDTNSLHLVAYTDNSTADAIGFFFGWTLLGVDL